MLKTKLGITFFGIAEILIGGITLTATLISLLQGTSSKPLEVLIFVLVTGTISLSLGIGIMRRSIHSYHMLLFFSTIVIISKILIFAKIFTLSGALETSVPGPIKNIISMSYHGMLIYFLSRPNVKKEFGETGKALFYFHLPFLK